MAADEQVLVVEQKVVAEEGLFHGLNFNVEGYLRRLFSPGALKFMPRPQAESDPNYKQIIPYVIMTHADKYLTYVRGKRAGEKRLVGNRSIGIGGHINPIDDEVPLFGTDFREIYLTAVQREVAEEIKIGGGHTDNIVALLNDDSNDVGKVHLGIVHYWTVDSDDITRREQMINQLSLMTMQELQQVRDEMETWSSLCLDGLEQMAEANQSAGSLEGLFEN
ncbi:MAG: hypothetical protein KAR47_13905 [Planctomycetes bacterium]|nr:hypothetical protein [Planctomycetota bacterium]